MTNGFEDRPLAKYQIIKEIGHGNMGTVYLGHDPFLDRPVAIKIARENELAGTYSPELFRKLFFNEAQAAGMLKHPNITSIYDAGVDGDVYYIVMEFVPGGDTLDHYRSMDSLLSVQEAITLIYKCANALAYAHDRGVIHRDIKPRNILVTEDRDVKLSDFGIALITGLPETELIAHAGSPLYMSPEQVRGETLAAQTDLFSLGVVAYELLTGHHPFAAGNVEAVNHMIMNSRPRPLHELRADVPDVLQRVIDRTLAKDPARRYRSGQDLAADLSLVFDFLEPAQEAISRQQKYNALRALEFCREFSDAEVWELVNASSWQRVHAGTEIILQGEVDKSFYLVVTGSVDVKKNGQYIDQLGEGDCFGEMGLLSGAQRTATVTAHEACTIMKVQAPLIERASVSCQLRFHKRFLYTLVERLSRTTERITHETELAG